MPDLMEQIVDRIEDVTLDLKRGMRILVQTMEPCGCDSNKRSTGKKNACRLCNGRGFILDAKTFLPDE
jgi:hypothetical protein